MSKVITIHHEKSRLVAEISRAEAPVSPRLSAKWSRMFIYGTNAGYEDEVTKYAEGGQSRFFMHILEELDIPPRARVPLLRKAHTGGLSLYSMHDVMAKYSTFLNIYRVFSAAKGTTYTTTPPTTDPDAGHAGFIFLTMAAARDKYGAQRLPARIKSSIKSELANEVTMYAAWRRRDIFTYKVYDPEAPNPSTPVAYGGENYDLAACMYHAVKTVELVAERHRLCVGGL